MTLAVRWLIAAGAALALIAAGYALAGNDVPQRSIRVMGQATVTAQTDQAVIDLGVMTRSDTARRAADDNARESERVLDLLRAVVGAAGTMTTVAYAVRPEYRYLREGGELKMSGYVATNVVRITTSQLDRVAEIIDAGIQTGANRVERIRFTLKDEQAVYMQAQREAATRARAQADALASTLGLRVVGILAVVDESSAPVRPSMDAVRIAAPAAESLTTPIEPGVIDVEARVLLTVEISGAP
jgi:uncharacterized protein YggE